VSIVVSLVKVMLIRLTIVTRKTMVMVMVMMMMMVVVVVVRIAGYRSGMGGEIYVYFIYSSHLIFHTH